ncbi:MAG: substrate-binding domain-containing protein, partial [Lachnospiraceae bacterium]|nr:substrate-binding domain-containing protein [Lachnospiraceae bacterium]
DALRKKYPQLSLRIVPVDFSNPFDALESEHMDCLLYWPELKPDSVEYLPLFEGNIHAYLNKKHPLCQKQSVSIKDIVSIPHIVFGNISGPTDPAYLRDVPQEMKKNIKLIKVPDVMTSRRMLELNQGVVLSPTGGILSDSEEIREVTIAEYSRRMQMGLCYKKDNRNPALMELLNYLKNE